MNTPHSLKLGSRELREIGEDRMVEGVTRMRSASFERLDLKRGDDSAVVTPGKIDLSLSSPSTEEVHSLFDKVAEVDMNAHHEMSFEERYENIEDYEQDGYVLASYAKVEGGIYRVVFQVPFHREDARKRFAEDLPEDGFEEAIFWEGNDSRISQLVNVLKGEGWSLSEAVLDIDDEVGRGRLSGKEAVRVAENVLEED